MITKESSPESIERLKVLKDILSDHHKMDFTIQTSLLPLRIIDNVIPYLYNDEIVENWKDINNVHHFTWLVATY